MIGRGLNKSRRVRRSLSCSSRMFTRLSHLTASTRSRAFSRRPRNRQSPFTGRVSPSTFPKTPFAGCHIESRSAVASRGGLASGLYSALYSPFWHSALILTTSTPEASCRRMAGSRHRLDSSCFADTERRRSTTSRKTSGSSLLRFLRARLPAISLCISIPCSLGPFVRSGLLRRSRHDQRATAASFSAAERKSLETHRGCPAHRHGRAEDGLNGHHADNAGRRCDQGGGMLRGPGCAPQPQTGPESDERRGSQWDHPSPRHGVERGGREVFIPLRTRVYEG